MIEQGTRHGGLVALSTKRVETSGGNIRYDVVCRCDCGREVVVVYRYWRSHQAYRCSRECAVVPKRKSRCTGPGGLAKKDHPLYGAYSMMKARCSPGTAHSAGYYDRGIRVCPEWASDFWRFVADVGERPEGMSLDRIDNDGHYEPSNVRWATRAQQQANRRPYQDWGKKNSVDDVLVYVVNTLA